MMDHFHVLHPVYGIIFLKQSEMFAPYQLFNNLLNYAFNTFTAKRDCSGIYRSLPNATTVEI